MMQNTLVESTKNLLPTQILAGEGALEALSSQLPAGATAVFFDAGLAGTPLYARAQRALKGAQFILLPSREPRVSDVQAALTGLRQKNAAAIVGMGGGSVMDVAKAVAVALEGTLSIEEALAAPPQTRRAFLAAVPTTAGTGSETTPNALLIDDGDASKRALISPACVCDLAVLDPTLSKGLPPAITSYTGVDAICHLAESFLSVRATGVSRFYSQGGLQMALRCLRACVENGADLSARMGMLYASFWGGVALSLAGTTAVHALAYALSRHGVPHGVANALLFAPVMEETLPDIRARLPEYEAIRALIQELPLPGIGQYGLSPADIPSLAEYALLQQRLLKNHPAPVDLACASRIFQRLF